MKVRHEANMKDVNRLRADGVDLVWTSSHINASSRCAPYQGRLYSLSGKTGLTDDGISYTPYQEAADGPLNDGNGIINGYNCRHYLIEYFPGSTPPREWDADTIKRERAIDIRQRQYENTIRNLKAQEAIFRATGMKEEASITRKQWQALTNEYKWYSNSNGRPFYIWRTALSKDELYAPEGYHIPLDDRIFPRSLGAKTIMPSIFVVDDNKNYYLAENTNITKVKVFAGKGTNTAIRVAPRLSQAYNVSEESWKKVRGECIVDFNGTNRTAEAHWYESDESEDTKYIEMKVKRWFD